jgi:SAM-dependent MidA family methyltransferase
LNPLHQIISNVIRKTGWISFESFMELALYCPEYGFYEREADKVGRKGDFFTSVSVGRLFGELLAFQFSAWLAEISGTMGVRAPLRIMEAGAYNGQLAHDVLTWIQKWRPQIFEQAEYCIVEPSSRLREKQTALLSGFGSHVHLFSTLAEVAECSGVCGIIFSNELLDAMPVRRFGWDKSLGVWFEWGVTFESGKFIWMRMPGSPDSAEAPSVSPELLEVLPDGYTTETCPSAGRWWFDAAKTLRLGKLMALDYGLTAGELISPERTRGTLRMYSRHHVGDDLLADPGGQDITAHVNFTAIQRTGEMAGLRTGRFCPQENFLISVAEQTWKHAESFGEWDLTRRRQFQTLVHPQHLGRSFRVLVQSREACSS